MNQHPLFLQLPGEVARGLVKTGDDESTVDEIAGDGTHSNATGTYEIDGFDIFILHCSLI